jgi:hypothetical protein
VDDWIGKFDYYLPSSQVRRAQEVMFEMSVNNINALAETKEKFELHRIQRKVEEFREIISDWKLKANATTAGSKGSRRPKPFPHKNFLPNRLCTELVSLTIR